MTDIWKTVTLTASVKAERILFGLPAMRKNSALCRRARSFKKVLSATLLYATQCKVQVKNFLVDSTLCRIAGSRTESSFVVEFNRISPRIRIYMQNRVSPWIRGPRGTVSQKTEGRKSRKNAPLISRKLRNYLWNGYNFDWLPSNCDKWRNDIRQNVLIQN
jgi:hypothetical protein